MGRVPCPSIQLDPAHARHASACRAWINKYGNTIEMGGKWINKGGNKIEMGGKWINKGGTLS
jgi:hypothetical protein